MSLSGLDMPRYRLALYVASPLDMHLTVLDILAQKKLKSHGGNGVEPSAL